MRITVATAVACLLGVGISTAHDAQAAIKQDTTIPAQGLGSALKQLADERDIQFVYRYEIVGERQTSGAVGELTFDQALIKLLKGTGLTYQYLDDRAVTIVPMGSSSTQASGANTPGSTNGVWERFRLAQAEQGSPTPSSSASRDLDRRLTLEEVIVTAQKREERLQDVPLSVTAITGEQMEEQGAIDIKDLLRSVPGLSFTDAERGSSDYSIRGIANSQNAPTTAIYLDDVSLNTGAKGTFAGALDLILFDMERVEVLKGPQGTLYGGSAMGGAIKYVSAKPNLSKSTGSLLVGMGTTAHGSESYNVEGVLSLPLITDVLAVRAGAAYMHEGGYVDNVAGLDVERASFSSTPFPVYTPDVRSSLSTVDLRDINSADSIVGRVSLLWKPDETWSITPTMTYQQTTLDGPNWILTNHGGYVDSLRYPELETPDRAGIYSLEITKDWREIEFTSLTGYVSRNRQYERDYSFYIGTLAGGAFYPYPTKIKLVSIDRNFSQEFRIASSPEWHPRLSWLGGLYFTRNEELAETNQIYTDGGGIGVLFEAHSPKIVTKEYAAFSSVSYALTDALDVTAGLRLFRNESLPSATGAISGFLLGGATFVTPGVIADHEKGISPRFGLSYDIDRDHMLYATAARGFRRGYSLNNPIPLPGCAADYAALGGFPERVEPDKLWSYELGSKNTVLDGRAVVNAAAFYSDWDDIQQTVVLPCGSGFPANAGKARVRGIELESSFDITDAFQFGGNGSYIDAKIVDASFSLSKDGDEVLDTPRWMTSLYASYAMPLHTGWDLKLRLDYQYRSEQRAQIGDSIAVLYADGVGGSVQLPHRGLYQDGYDVVNAYALLNTGPVKIRLYLHNVFDNRPFLDNRFDRGATRTVSLQPRTIGVELRRDF